MRGSALFSLVLVVLSAPLRAQDAAAPVEGLATTRGLDGFITVERLPVPDSPALAHGRDVWGGTCYRCHGGDRLSGAPKITSLKAWTPRISKGFDVLTEHAISGFIGERYDEMPPRGGNSDLSDADVKAAVAFMVWASGGRAEAETYAATQLRK